MPSLRLFTVFAALFLSAADAAAQMEFAGIPWGTPPRETADRLQALGYRLRGVDQEGDWVFRGPDGAEVIAVMDTAGLISVDVRWYERPDEFPRRLQVLVDSLTAAFGEPLNREEESAVWNRQEAWVHLFMRRAYGGRDSMLFLAHTRPGGLGDEPRRRAAMADAREAHLARHGPDPAAAGEWHLLWDEIWVETRVDTAHSAATGIARYRARMLEHWQEPQRLENGLMYDGVLTEVELDCKEFRRRLHRTVFVFYQAPVAIVDVPEAERAWFRPEPEQLDGYLLRDACVVLDRQH